MKTCNQCLQRESQNMSKEKEADETTSSSPSKIEQVSRLNKGNSCSLTSLETIQEVEHPSHDLDLNTSYGSLPAASVMKRVFSSDLSAIVREGSDLSDKVSLCSIDSLASSEDQYGLSQKVRSISNMGKQVDTISDQEHCENHPGEAVNVSLVNRFSLTDDLNGTEIEKLNIFSSDLVEIVASI